MFSTIDVDCLNAKPSGLSFNCLIFSLYLASRIRTFWSTLSNSSRKRKSWLSCWGIKTFLLTNRDRSTRRKGPLDYAANQKNMLTHLCLIREAAILQKIFLDIHLIEEDAFSEGSVLVNISFELFDSGTGNVVINTICCSSFFSSLAVKRNPPESCADLIASCQ